MVSGGVSYVAFGRRQICANRLSWSVVRGRESSMEEDLFGGVRAVWSGFIPVEMYDMGILAYGGLNFGGR